MPRSCATHVRWVCRTSPSIPHQSHRLSPPSPAPFRFEGERDATPRPNLWCAACALPPGQASAFVPPTPPGFFVLRHCFGLGASHAVSSPGQGPQEHALWKDCAALAWWQVTPQSPCVLVLPVLFALFLWRCGAIESARDARRWNLMKQEPCCAAGMSASMDIWGSCPCQASSLRAGLCRRLSGGLVRHQVQGIQPCSRLRSGNSPRGTTHFLQRSQRLLVGDRRWRRLQPRSGAPGSPSVERLGCVGLVASRAAKSMCL